MKVELVLHGKKTPNKSICLELLGEQHQLFPEGANLKVISIEFETGVGRGRTQGRLIEPLALPTELLLLGGARPHFSNDPLGYWPT